MKTEKELRQALQEHLSQPIVRENWLEREHDLIDYEKFLWLLQTQLKLPSDVYVDIRMAMDACILSKTALVEMAKEYEETGCNKGDACFS